MTEYYTPSHIKSVLFELALETVSDENAVCRLGMLALVADRLGLADDAQRIQTLANVWAQGFGLADPSHTALRCLSSEVKPDSRSQGGNGPSLSKGST